MPLYMDVHIIPGVKARDVAEAHRKDLLHQEEHACKCMTYWIDEERESIFCLIEAPDKESVEEMHNHAHGLIPNKIIEVSSTLVESFLGRIYDPETEISEDGLKIFQDPSFRVLLVVEFMDLVLLQNKSGADKKNEWLNTCNNIIRKNLDKYGGKEAEHAGSSFIISFTSAAKAISCALAIQKELPSGNDTSAGFRIGLNAGEPVTSSNKLFGDTLQLAENICSIAKEGQVAVASLVKKLVPEVFQNPGDNIVSLSPQDEALLALLIGKLEENWQDPDFNAAGFGQAVAMSKSQLYRKTTELFGMSPNILIKEFRLEKAKELMRKQRYTISQITFDSGFSSPSYFTKCFKKKYGLLPMAYLDLLHRS
jgi:AraC-like DNA-binding protein